MRRLTKLELTRGAAIQLQRSKWWPASLPVATRVRSFLVFPLPFLLALAALSFVPKDATAPAFAAQWSATVKFLAAFLAMVSGIIAFQLALHLWAKWIDPDGLGKRERRLSTEIDNLGFLGFMMAIAAHMPFAKELDFSFAVQSAFLATWFASITLLSSLVRRHEKSTRLQNDAAHAPVKDC